MREIKFRAWDSELNFYVDQLRYFIELDGSVWFNLGTNDGGDSLLDQSEKLIIEQFTGLHDKNGKEIYEGDIVAYFALHCDKYISDPSEKTIGTVIFYKDRCQFLPQEIEKNIRGGNYITPWDFLKEIVIIGNIHENPELLSK